LPGHGIAVVAEIIHLNPAWGLSARAALQMAAAGCLFEADAAARASLDT
jgi:hypothetical protein